MRKKVTLTPEQIRLRELEKILKKDFKRFLRFLEAAGEIGSKELYRLSHWKFEEYLYFKFKNPALIGKKIKDSAIDYYEANSNMPLEKRRLTKEINSASYKP